MKKAFSIFELSIVILIIGLISAGILTGNSLVKQARFKKLIDEYQQLNNSFINFQTKYNYFPGDYSEAYNQWGSDCGTDGDVNNNAANCNGDGDYKIEWSGESYRAWQHLELGGFINGSYSGLAATSPNNFQLNSIQDGVFDRLVTGAGSSTNGIAADGGSNQPLFLMRNTNGNALLTTKELYLFDKKFDDGLAYQGKIRNRFTDYTLCDGANETASLIDVAADQYDLSNENIICVPIFILDNLLN